MTFWPQNKPFSQNKINFDKMETFNDILVKFIPWNSFSKFFVHFPQILTYDVILAHKWAILYQKWTIATKLIPLIIFFSKIHPWMTPWNNFLNIFKKFFYPFSQILTYNVILVKNQSFLRKRPILNQIDPFNYLIGIYFRGN